MVVESRRSFTLNGFEYSYCMRFQNHVWQRMQERKVNSSAMHKAIKRFHERLMDIADADCGLEAAIRDMTNEITMFVIPSWNDDGDLLVTVKTVLKGVDKYVNRAVLLEG